MDDELEVIETFHSPAQAGMARSLLAAEGIEVYLLDEHVASVTGGHAFFPTRLQVRAADAERARALLAEGIDPAELERQAEQAARQAPAEDEDGFAAPAPTAAALERCPACGSDLIEPAPFPLETVLASLVLAGLPLLFMSPPRACRSCGHRWRG